MVSTQSSVVKVVDAEQDNAPAPTLASVIAPLREIDEDSRKYGARMLMECHALLEEVQELLANRRPPEDERLADQDRILVTYLRAYYAGVCATPAIIHGDLMEAELVASGIVAPFVQPGPSGAARFGVPSKLSPSIMCETASELLRMAVAALVCLFVYLNFRQSSTDLAPDDTLLLFATISISSCATEANAAAIDAELAGLGAPAGWGCSQVRWLMHYVRSQVMHHMGGVCYVLGDTNRQAQCYAAQQRDAQAMIKALPACPLGYTLYARCCMSFQQMVVAAAFLARGLDVARQAGDDAGEAAMCFQRAVALVMGGTATGEFDGSEVLALQEAGEEARASLLTWFPQQWQGYAMDGEPDRSLLATRLLPEWVRRSAAGASQGAASSGDKGPDAAPSEQGEVAHGDDAGTSSTTQPPPISPEAVEAALVAGGAHCKALDGLLYVAKPPGSIPPGALVGVDGEEGSEEAAAS